MAGIQYHETPYQLRHSSTLLHGSKIEEAVLTRLSGILETDRSRTQQAFFTPWFEIKRVAADILEGLNYYKLMADDIILLRTLHRKFEHFLARLPKLLCNLVAGLEFLEEAVAQVSERSNLDGSAALASKYSREGGLFRRWIQTFPEVENGLVDSKSRYIEWYVETVLDIGVERDRYWRRLVELS